MGTGGWGCHVDFGQEIWVGLGELQIPGGCDHVLLLFCSLRSMLPCMQQGIRFYFMDACFSC